MAAPGLELCLSVTIAFCLLASWGVAVEVETPLEFRGGHFFKLSFWRIREYLRSRIHCSWFFIWVFASFWNLRVTQPEMRGVTPATQPPGPLAIPEHLGGTLWRMTCWLHLRHPASAQHSAGIHPEAFTKNGRPSALWHRVQ